MKYEDKMRYLLLILSFILIVVSCDKRELPEEEGDSILLRFQTSRALWNKTPKTDYTGNSGTNPIPDMVVYGYYTQNSNWFDVRNATYPKFMDGVIVTNDGGAWSYQSPRYFFKEGKHSFLAFAPYSIVAADNRNSFSIPNNSGTPVLNYNLPNNILDSKDLMFGWKTDIEQATQGSNPVDIRFVHATTKITFSASISSEYFVPVNMSIKIKSIAINDIYTNGQLQIAYNTTVNEEGISGVSWLNHGGLQDIFLSSANQSLRDINLTKTMTSISPVNTALYMIPQKIANRAAGEGSPTLTILIEISNNTTNTTTTETLSFDLTQVIQSWKPGNFSDFQITYNGNGNPISLILVDPGTGDPSDLGPPLGQ